MPASDACVGQLPPEPWLQDPAISAVFEVLAAGGATARFVGGCVRDAVVRKPVHDIDIAVTCPPDCTVRLLDAAGIRTVATGLAHGTVTAVLPDRHLEITTLRRDVETDGRHAVVAYTDDWAEDAARRDFTMNALYADREGRIFDYTGGLRDLGAGLVRFVGDPAQRIMEDALRLLRYFRFHAWYGRPPPDPAALAACRALSDTLRALSAERVKSELLRILLAPDPAGALLLMQGEGVLARVLPEAGRIDRLRQVAWLVDRGLPGRAVTPDPMRRLGAVLEPALEDPERIEAVGERLRLSRTEIRRLKAMLGPLPGPGLAPDPSMDQAAARVALDAIGRVAFVDRLLLAWGGERAGTGKVLAGRSAGWQGLLDLALAWDPPPFPVGGNDLMAVGVPPGPAVGEALATLRRDWVAGGCVADRDAILAAARQVAGTGPAAST